jgi:hypothetical protein
MSGISLCLICVFVGERWNEKSIGKTPNAVSANHVSKKSRRPEVPDRPTRFPPGRRKTRAAEVTPPSHCASQFVFRGTDKRIGHHEQLIVYQLSFTLPSESRLVSPELDTVEFQAKRFDSGSNLSRQPLIARKALPALHIPNQTCDDGDKPAYRPASPQATPETSST